MFKKSSIWGAVSTSSQVSEMVELQTSSFSFIGTNTSVKPLPCVHIFTFYGQLLWGREKLCKPLLRTCEFSANWPMLSVFCRPGPAHRPSFCLPFITVNYKNYKNINNASIGCVDIYGVRATEKGVVGFKILALQLDGSSTVELSIQFCMFLGHRGGR